MQEADTPQNDTPQQAIPPQEADLPATTTAPPATALRGALLRSELKWAVPFLGALGLMVHFWRIGYAPSLSLGDLGTVLGAFVMFSTYALALLLVLVLIPGAFFGYWIERHVLPPPLREARSPTEEKPKGLRSLRRRAMPPHRKLIDRIAVWRSVPEQGIGSARIIEPPATSIRQVLWQLPLCAVTALALQLWLLLHSGDCNVAYRVAFWSLFCVGMLVLTFGFSFPDWSVVQRRMRGMRQGWVRCLLLLTLYLAFWPILLGLLLTAIPTSLDEAGGPYLVMSVILLVVLHYWLYASYRKPLRLRLAATIGGVIMVVVYSQVLFAIVDSAVNRFGFGMMRNVDMVVTRQGCDIANAGALGRVCKPIRGSDTTAYRLGKVDVFTRIGPTFLVGAPGSLVDPTKPRLTLPADQVLSWSRPAKPPAKNQNCKQYGSLHGPHISPSGQRVLEHVSGSMLEEPYRTEVARMIRGHADIYALYKREKLYYVGLATNLMPRVKQHLKDRHARKWDTVIAYLTRDSEQIKALESLLLRIVEPSGNLVKSKLPGAKDQKRILHRAMTEADSTRRAALLAGHFVRNRMKRKTAKTSGTVGSAGLVNRRMQLRVERKGVRYTATLRKDGHVSFQGKLDASPSMAGRAALGRNANGWLFWHYRAGSKGWIALDNTMR